MSATREICVRVSSPWKDTALDPIGLRNLSQTKDVYTFSTSVSSLGGMDVRAQLVYEYTHNLNAREYSSILKTPPGLLKEAIEKIRT